MSDLPVQAAPGQEYGARADQERRQRAVPMGTNSPPTPLTAPSQRPNEPVQAGLATGPGPGPEALGAMDSRQLTRATLQAMLRRYPSETIERMLMDMDLD